VFCVVCRPVVARSLLGLGLGVCGGVGGGGGGGVWKWFICDVINLYF